MHALCLYVHVHTYKLFVYYWESMNECIDVCF